MYIYRGFDIEVLSDGKVKITQQNKLIHEALTEELALAWVDVELRRQRNADKAETGR